ncbi:flavin reductase family protein [Luteimonas sp. BDR2-5]|uniref:flavin reductase family protein n=1 Tax=Proluteimonas luteida TaxID=2878685 RepID=UPI001E48A877|nr:flavin reductase family protein [Luteimonas sp. BDR2-5]MCD9028847.1 flavin reductase family protein [Luteimonas sp. BDR2-5]
MKRYRKHDFPTNQVRRFLEPGPVVLVSTAWNGERGIMTMGWHMMLGWNLVGAYITAGTHSHRLARGSGECVINLPTLDLLDTAVGIGNCSGSDGDKFDRFGLSASPAARVRAPLIAECHSSFECVLREAHDNADYDLFVWEVVQAHVAPVPKRPRTVHYRGNGEFMVSGKEVSRRRLFRPEMLEE